MNVGELIAKLSRMNPSLPVVIDQEDVELFGQYVELMHIEVSTDDVRYAPEDFSLDGSKPYTRPDWAWSGSAERNAPTIPVAMVSCKIPHRPTIDGELDRPAIEGR
ncbi:Uncharacterised protein [Mycobacteroides abscessus subsp. bolletii]|uniref:hypothetical protein n=1 Tax=Mycobacteroides abscessus TaxID=36809 RepID=UPI00092C39CD|nr:hypothetical protein [Mycobacteroides abscessus]SHQ63038.1 Uncharacterised protein [Mycobacteroides abscessus subsp. bolletii]SHS46671.1 Uncharacterised protein [Mycobacteroides abscessus subsp. bolletii]SHT08201.1 Uncharacterised protein [Mycobacteroides abscessus subsp. bolletii]SHT13630.1 Uncharacterised protein [Mycobacteroides abscessus subsp. bolletii]SHY51244.1 Uncharacterised protein [Mycobacteroides abscessus subsp. bolletii]